MRKITRKELLKGGLAGAASLAAVPFASSLAFASEGGHVAVHIHARVEKIPGQAGPAAVDISVDAAGQLNQAGPFAPLSGAGWDSANFDSANQSGACYFSQRGHLEGDDVHLHGRVFFSNTASFVGVPVTTSANLKTRHVKWTFDGLTFTCSVGVVTKID